MTTEEKNAKIYCYEEIRTLKTKRFMLNSYYTAWAKSLVNQQKCLGIKDV